MGLAHSISYEPDCWFEDDSTPFRYFSICFLDFFKNELTGEVMSKIDSSSLAAGAGGPLEEETCPFSRRGLPSPEVLPDNSKQHKNPITYQKEKHLTFLKKYDDPVK